MQLNEILNKIVIDEKFKKKLTSSLKGKDFEETFKEELSESSHYISYSSSSFKKHPHFKNVKELIRENNKENFLETPLLNDISKDPRYIYQPFGSQQSPDFLFIRQNKILPVELKFTCSKKKNPVWNSGLPLANYNYIFGSSKTNDITFFKGRDIIEESEHKSLIELVKQYRNDLEKEAKNYCDSFAVYLRPMYNQKDGLWTNHERKGREESLIEVVTKFEE